MFLTILSSKLNKIVRVKISFELGNPPPDINAEDTDHSIYNQSEIIENCVMFYLLICKETIVLYVASLI